MVNLKLSPGDPLFYLHHAWLDRMWWKWQSLDRSTRLTAMGGPNIPPSTLPPFLSGPGATGRPPIDPSCIAGQLAGAGGRQATSNMAGRDEPAHENLEEHPVLRERQVFGKPAPWPQLTDYFNDGGNVTTLAHTLWSLGLVRNVTVGDIMDIGGDFVCADYV